MNYPDKHALYLAIDQGGHASRALVFNHEGEQLAAAYAPLAPQQPQPRHVEYDSHALLASLRQAIAQVLGELGAARDNIRAAGLATQRSNVACWDRYSGQALAPILSWQDRRGAAQVECLRSHGHRIHQLTGLFLSPHYGASKLHWYLTHEPAVQQALQEQRLAWGPMAGYLVHQLVSERPHVVDAVNASRTQLLNLDTMDWEPELLSLFEVPAEPLPEVVSNAGLYGELAQAPAIPLRLVSGDQSAAMYAYGPLQPDTAYLNIGTGAFVSRPSGRARLDGRRLLTSLIHYAAGEPEYALEGTVNGAGAALEWYAREYRMPDVFTQLPGWLLQNHAHRSLFLNGVAGLGAPFWISDFPTPFIGSEDPVDRAVAVAESIVFLIQASLDEMHKFASPPEQIQLTGGLAQWDGLAQRIADLSDLPVYRPRLCEATGRGTAFLLAGRPRHWPEPEPGDWFEPRPNPELKVTYERWTGLMLQEMRRDE